MGLHVSARPDFSISRSRLSWPAVCRLAIANRPVMFLDESNVLTRQFGDMYNGDRARKQTLVEYGFRLPSATARPAAGVRGV